MPLDEPWEQDRRSRKVSKEDTADYFVMQVAQNVGNLPKLDQSKLIQRIKKHDYPSHLVNKFMKHNQRFVISIARRYRNKGLDFADLVQEGNLGMLRALYKFDPSRGFQFSTMAYYWIHESIGRAVKNKGKSVRLPIYIYDESNQIKKVWSNGIQTEKRTLSSHEIARTLNKDPKRVEMFKIYDGDPDSLDREIAEDLDLSSRIPDYKYVADRGIEESEDKRKILEVVASLPKPGPELISKRFGLHDGRPRSKADLAVVFRMNRDQIAKMEKKFLALLKERLKDIEFNMELDLEEINDDIDFWMPSK